MSEPESLATVEALDAHVRRHAYDRLLMLSDGIFAIAITLAALEIQPPGEHGSFAIMAHAMLRPILAYLLSFAIIGIFWIQHRDLFARVRRADGPLTVLTLVLLCLVALLPAVVHGVYLPGDDEAPFRLYALVMVSCGLTNAALWIYASLRPGLMASEVTQAYRWSRVIGTLGMQVVFAPALFVPVEQMPTVLGPLAAGLLILRRVVLPRWVAKGR
jgi:TMEM175 potassium channel family protein